MLSKCPYEHNFHILQRLAAPQCQSKVCNCALCWRYSSSKNTQYCGQCGKQENTALQLWRELAQLYFTSFMQAVKNFQAKLGALNFKDGKHWDQYYSTFLLVLDELSV